MTNPPPAATSGWSLQPTMDWLFSKGRMIGDNNRFTLELATRLVVAGAVSIPDTPGLGVIFDDEAMAPFRM